MRTYYMKPVKDIDMHPLMSDPKRIEVPPKAYVHALYLMSSRTEGYRPYIYEDR